MYIYIYKYIYNTQIMHLPRPATQIRAEENADRRTRLILERQSQIRTRQHTYTWNPLFYQR